MLRGCLTSLAYFVLLSYGYYYWLDQVFEPPGSIIGALVAGFLVLCCLGALWNARTSFRYWSMMSVARHDLVLSDGRLTAVCGTIHPIGSPLRAPFSGAECVICEYDLALRTRVTKAGEDAPPGSDYAGFLMTPSVIRTPFGEVRIVGFPILDGFDDLTCRNAMAARNGREFLRSTQFEDRAGLKFVGVLTVFGKIWHDDDGLVDVNFRFSSRDPDETFPPGLVSYLPVIERWETEHPDSLDGSDEEEELDDDSMEFDQEMSEHAQYQRMTAGIPKMTEKRVGVGEQVCAVGIYQEALRGLSPLSRGRNITQLIKGSAEEVGAGVWKNSIRRLLGGLIGLAAIHGVILGAMQIYLHSPDVQHGRERAAFQAVSNGNVDELEPILRRGMDVDIRDSDERTLLMLSRDADVSEWLIAHGAKVNLADKEGVSALMMAAANGRTEIVEKLIASGADVNQRNKTGNLTALRMAEVNGHADVVEVLKKAGAKE